MNISEYLEIKRDIVEDELQNIINGLRITRLDKVSSNRDIHLYKTKYLQNILGLRIGQSAQNLANKEKFSIVNIGH